MSGCGRSNEDIYEDCAPVIEDLLKKNGIEGAKCTQILDIREDGKDRYTAVANVKYEGEEELVNIKISYDNDNDMVIVEIAE